MSLMSPEVLYEDLHYLLVSAFSLACSAALLMSAMWLLDKACRRMAAARRSKQTPGKETRTLVDDRRLSLCQTDVV